MLVFGSAIGSGNYSRPSGEVVNCETQILIGSSGAVLADDDGILNLEALTDGKIPKGCKTVSLNSTVLNSSISSDEGVMWGPISTQSYDQKNFPPVDSIYNSQSGAIRCDANGDIYQTVTEAGATISYCARFVTRIQLR
jgi:hypothetical protein